MVLPPVLARMRGAGSCSIVVKCSAAAIGGPQNANRPPLDSKMMRSNDRNVDDVGW